MKISILLFLVLTCDMNKTLYDIEIQLWVDEPVKKDLGQTPTVLYNIRILTKFTMNKTETQNNILDWSQHLGPFRQRPFSCSFPVNRNIARPFRQVEIWLDGNGRAMFRLPVGKNWIPDASPERWETQDHKQFLLFLL